MVPAVTRLCSFVESGELCRKQESEKTQRANRTKRQRKLSCQRVNCRKGILFQRDKRDSKKAREEKQRDKNRKGFVFKVQFVNSASEDNRLALSVSS